MVKYYYCPKQKMFVFHVFSKPYLRDCILIFFFHCKISVFEETTLSSLVVPAFFQHPQYETSDTDMTKFRQFVNKMNKYGFAAHASVLYLISGILIYLPTGCLLNFYFFSTPDVQKEQDLASYMTQWYMPTSFFGGWVLYMAFAFAYFKVSFYYLLS